MSVKMRKDKRSYRRSQVRWPVTMIASNTTMEGETRDVSTLGAFIYCQEPLGPAENLFLSLKLPAGSPLEISARVVWSNFSNIEDTTRPRGMGVRFLW